MTMFPIEGSVESPAAVARREIAEEHRALRTLLERLETTADLQILLPRLDELRRLLALHFAREEAPDGLHRVVDSSAPHLVVSVQGLFEEHRECLAEIERLAEEAHVIVEGPLAELRRGVSELCRKLHEHEAAETELLAGALYDDLGGGD
ncbi:MAG TPA: hypothetical protein VLF66_20095 [Thermoanaerobaculia bacterium]|nr:hypothetical protein [Thermoanaerobaculia bacterium]